MLTQVVNGRPRDPAVRKLIDTFGVERGTLITRDKIAATIGDAVDSGRYRSIVSAWQTKLRKEHGVVAKAQNGVGYELLKPSAQIQHGVGLQRQSIRKLVKSNEVVSGVPDKALNERDRSTKVHILDSQERLVAMMRNETRTVSFLAGKVGMESN